MKPARRRWTEADQALLVERFATHNTAALAAVLGRNIRSVYNMAYKLGLAKDPAMLVETRRRTLAEGRRSAAARSTRFQPGQRPWNKGKHYMPGGRSPEGRFKPGRRPEECRNYLPIGSLRISLGYLQRKMTDDQRLVPERRWTAVHRLVWEAAHGPIPRGHVVCFLPGRHSTQVEQITLDALELVSRADLALRNSRHNLPPEINQLIHLRASLTRAIKKRTKREEQDAERA